VNCARWDLCGGYWLTDIPTAILDRIDLVNALIINFFVGL
jgi:hypothetical protein